MNIAIKMDKKHIFATGILLFLVVISGCSEGGLGRGKKNPITEVDVRKGTDGIKMEFLPNAPPQNVFAESGFPVSLKIKNAGASDITEDNKGTVVFGFEKAYINISEGKILFDIKGKSIYNPLGDEEFITVNARAGAIGPQSEKHPSTIFATACYPYNTIFGDSVCIDTDIIGESKVKACIAKDLAFTKGQGAPVTVTKVETRMLPQDDGKVKPHFLIYVKNSGNGEVIDPSEINNACTSSALDYADFNTLKVSAALSGVPLRCNEDNKGAVPGPTTVRLRDKEDLIRCTYDKGGGIDAGLDAYVAPLKVELEYGYTFTISKNIIIEKVLAH